jgi:hypothetical protein
MQVVRLQKVVDKVTLLQRNNTGGVTPIILSEKKRRKKKKKSSFGLGGPEMIAQRVIDAQRAFADTLANRFRSSRRKQTNGWLVDMGNNLFRATGAGGKKFRLSRFPI